MTTAFTTITLLVRTPLSTLTLGPAGPATFAPLVGTPLAVTLLVRATLSPART